MTGYPFIALTSWFRFPNILCDCVQCLIGHGHSEVRFGDAGMLGPAHLVYLGNELLGDRWSGTEAGFYVARAVVQGWRTFLTKHRSCWLGEWVLEKASDWWEQAWAPSEGMITFVFDHDFQGLCSYPWCSVFIVGWVSLSSFTGNLREEFPHKGGCRSAGVTPRNPPPPCVFTRGQRACSGGTSGECVWFLRDLVNQGCPPEPQHEESLAWNDWGAKQCYWVAAVP